MLNSRLLEIINVIIDKGDVTLNELSVHLSITERMLRYDINSINELFIYYFNLELIEIKNSYVTLTITKMKCSDCIKKIPLKEYNFNNLERSKMIMFDILLFNNEFKLDEISDTYLLSKATIRNDIKSINKFLLEYDIKVRHTNKGYILSGDELNIRKCIINHLNEIKKDKYIFNFIEKKLSVLTIKKEICKKQLNEFMKLDNLKINDDTFDMILLYIYISKNRNIMGKYLQTTNVSNKLFLINTQEYEKIRSYFLEDNFPELDVEILTDFYLGLYNFNDKYSFFLNWINIENLVDRLIENLSNEFNIEFKEDDIFRKELIHHIKPCLYRINNKLHLGESINEDVKKEYGEIYFKTKKVFEYVEDIFNISLEDEEIAYITIMVKRSLDRLTNFKECSKIRILIVCGFGYSTSKLIQDELINNFDVEIIDNIPYNQLKNYTNIKNIDLIVTTIDFSSKSHDVIKVNPIFKSDDILKLERYGLKRKSKILESKLLSFIKNNKNKDQKTILKLMRQEFKGYIYNDIVKSNNERHIYDFVNERNTILNAEVKDMDELIDLVSKTMINNGYTEEGYENVLKKQIEKYGKYILVGNEMILPHGELRYMVKNTGFVFITLKKPIKFFGSDISIVIALATKDKDEHIRAILDINIMLRLKEFESKMKEQKDHKSLISYFKSNLGR